NSAVEFHFVDLARYCSLARIVVIGIGVRAVEVLMRSGRNANGPGRADVFVNLQEVQIAVEHLDAPILPVCDIDVAFRIRSNRMWNVQLPRLISARSNGFDESAVLVIFGNAGIRVAVGNEDVSSGIPRDVRWPGKSIGLCRRWRRAQWRRRFKALDGFTPSA